MRKKSTDRDLVLISINNSWWQKFLVPELIVIWKEAAKLSAKHKLKELKQ